MDADGWTLTEWRTVANWEQMARMWERGSRRLFAARVWRGQSPGRWHAYARGPHLGPGLGHSAHDTIEAAKAWCDEYLAAVSEPPEPPP